MDQILVVLIVLGAAAYLVRAWFGRKKGGCNSCAPASKPVDLRKRR